MEENKTKEEQVEELINNAGTQLDGVESYLSQLYDLIAVTSTPEQLRPFTAVSVHISDLREDLDWLLNAVI